MSDMLQIPFVPSSMSPKICRGRFLLLPDILVNPHLSSFLEFFQQLKPVLIFGLVEPQDFDRGEYRFYFVMEFLGQGSFPDLQPDKFITRINHFLLTHIKLVLIEISINLLSFNLDLVFVILVFIVYRPEFLCFPGSKIKPFGEKGYFISIEPLPVGILC